MEKDSAQSVASKPLADSRDTLYRLSLYFLMVSAFVVLPSSDALAAGAGDPLTQTLCTVIGWFTGGLGRSIATLGVVVIGIGAMLGKVSWQMAMTVAIGISVMFSGARVVELLTDRSLSCPGAGGMGAGMIEGVLCRMAGWANEPLGRAFGTLSVIFIGVSALMGKVSAGLALILAVGLGTVFNAEQIASILAGGVGWGCSPTGS